jgi:hypothetical protein
VRWLQDTPWQVRRWVCELQVVVWLVADGEGCLGQASGMTATDVQVRLQHSAMHVPQERSHNTPEVDCCLPYLVQNDHCS